MTSYNLLNSLDDALNLNHHFYSKPAAFHYCINHFNSIESLLKHFDQFTASFKINNPSTLKEKIKNFDSTSIKKTIKSLDISVITLNDPLYPPKLTHINAPPPVLFAKGNTSLLSTLSIAIVGTRNPSSYGTQVATYFSQGLCDNWTIVSGFAEGIDKIAHHTCLEKKGHTIAVMGTGLDQFYPRHHSNLGKKIIENNGLLLTEIPLYSSPQRFHFPLRNRTISGLCEGVIVCEAKEKSGSLITANYALEQNREVFAIPGPIFEPNVEGTLSLIQNGAKCTYKIQDIYDELNRQDTLPFSPSTTAPISSPSIPELTEIETKVFEKIQTNTSIDTIIENTKLPLSQVLHTLTFLELKNTITKHPGNLYSKQH